MCRTVIKLCVGSNLIKKDIERRSLVGKYEYGKIKLKYRVARPDEDKIFRFFCSARYNRRGWRFSYVSVRNRCFLNNNPQIANRYTGLNRCSFKRLGSTGFLSGIRRSSW